jgi:hypothetical protein
MHQTTIRKQITEYSKSADSRSNPPKIYNKAKTTIKKQIEQGSAAFVRQIKTDEDATFCLN